MPKKLSAKKAADQIESLIEDGHFKSAKKAAQKHPTLEPGVAEYDRRVEKRKADAKLRAAAHRPVGSGPARLTR